MKRRKSKPYSPPKYKTPALSPEERRRRKLVSRAHSGNTTDKRWGFSASKLGKSECYVFYASFAAHLLLEIFLDGSGPEWINDRELVTYDEVKIRGTGLREIADYELKPNEVKYYDLSDDYRKRALYIMSDVEAAPHTEGESTVRHRNSRKGMILIKDICNDLKVKPSFARSMLRKAKYGKPAKGWAWDHNDPEIARIKSIITGTRIVTVNFKGVKRAEAE